jgi:2-iminoacetate synthase
VYLILHIRHLAQRFPAVQISVSLPRIARTSHPTLARFVVDEEDLLRHVAILRLAVPFASIEISTREPAWLRERLIYVGANAMSVDASMRPEAWVECQHDGGDLQSGDVRNVSELLWDLEDLGCNVRWTAPVRWPGPRLRARPRRTAH